LTYSLLMGKVEVPVSPADWITCELQTCSGNRNFELLELNGRPALVKYEYSNRTLEIWNAATAVPLSAADWQITSAHNFAADAELGGFAVTAAEGLPVLAYMNGITRELHYLTTDTASPSGPADWNDVAVATGGFYAGLSAVTSVDSIPILITYDSDTDFDHIHCRFYTAKHANPLSPADWVQGDFPELKWQSAVTVLNFGGRPLLWSAREESGDPWFYFGLRPDPQSASDWESVMIPLPKNGGDVGTYPGGFFLGAEGLTGNFDTRQAGGDQLVELWYGFSPVN
jgi:hypothetical protein